MTPLHVAIYNENRDCAKLLIESSAILDIQNSKGFAAIHLACANGQYDVVSALIKYGANTNSKASYSDFTSLHISAGRGDLDIVQHLLTNRADRTLVDIDGNTPSNIALIEKKWDAYYILNQ